MLRSVAALLGHSGARSGSPALWRWASPALSLCVSHPAPFRSQSLRRWARRSLCLRVYLRPCMLAHSCVCLFVCWLHWLLAFCLCIGAIAHTLTHSASQSFIHVPFTSIECVTACLLACMFTNLFSSWMKCVRMTNATSIHRFTDCMMPYFFISFCCCCACMLLRMHAARALSHSCAHSFPALIHAVTNHYSHIHFLNQ